jgi:hypothetical protein
MAYDGPPLGNTQAVGVQRTQIVAVRVWREAERTDDDQGIGIVVGERGDGRAAASHLGAESFGHSQTAYKFAAGLRLTAAYTGCMARRTRGSSYPERNASQRAVRHDRHGRSGRSAVTGPHLPMLQNRLDLFDSTVASTAEFLRGSWPEELSNVRYEVAPMPAEAPEGGGVPRWATFPAARRIVLYRLPIQRLSRLHRDDELHQRMMIESCVFRATAELLGRDPWDLGPERFRFL